MPASATPMFRTRSPSLETRRRGGKASESDLTVLFTEGQPERTGGAEAEGMADAATEFLHWRDGRVEHREGSAKLEEHEAAAKEIRIVSECLGHDERGVREDREGTAATTAVDGPPRGSGVIYEAGGNLPSEQGSETCVIDEELREKARSVDPQSGDESSRISAWLKEWQESKICFLMHDVRALAT